MDGQVVEEINKYIGERDIIRASPTYLNPLLYWQERRTQYPCLFQLALKAMSVPATSVLSE